MSKKRKTRKEKIILSLKRKLSQQENFPSSHPATSRFSQTPPSSSGETKVEVLNIKAIKKDLLKSLFLSGVAILGEFLLYWWRLKK
ncbi:hypothetical protein J7J95_03170 [bacterium]|nr:hypothetical protein [bacterium]